MSHSIEDDFTDDTQQEAVVPVPSGDGRRTRYAFTFAILLALATAGAIFYALLGSTTQDVGTRLNIEVRSASQVYQKAADIETRTLRLRALRNFVSAYPDAPETELATTQIEIMEAAEHDAWRALSEIVYNVTKPASVKREALDAFIAQWDGGNYTEDALIMDGHIAQKLSKNRSLNEDTGSVPGLSGSDIKLPKRNPANDDVYARLGSDTLAGALPMARTYPIETIYVAPPVSQAIIVEAVISKDSKPRYPSRAQSRGIETNLTVSMDIGVDGKVIEARIVQGASGRYAADFNKAALRAAKRTLFTPKTIDGRAAPTNGFTRSYKFKLAD